VIQASLSVAGETREPHHWWATVLARRRELARSGRMQMSSGAQAAETVSVGSSTMSRRPEPALPKALVMNSNSRVTVEARSWAFSLFFSVT